MTTRITLTILLTTWVVLLVGEAGAYYTARQSLLALFDYNILNRAMSVLEAEAGGAKPALQAGDYYHRVQPLVKTLALGGDRNDYERQLVTLVEPPVGEFGRDTLGEKVRVMHIKLRAASSTGESTIYNVDYSRRTDRLDQLLTHIAGMLLLISLGCGIITAWVALKLSRTALRPLHETSNVIAKIDERQLGTRLDPSQMPAELQPIAKRLNEMLERLQHVFQQRKQFLADAAHELRTPTAALLTTLEVATRRPRDQAALLEALQSGLADARRLRRLVESLMEQARSDVKQAAHPVELDVVAMLRDCVQVVTPLAGEKDVKIIVDSSAPASLPFVTQPERLRSVMLNLLSNAIEYNRRGGTIDVRLEREVASGAIALTFRDTGIGISPEQLPHVFEPFYRGGAAGDDQNHLGLGLFLVRSHVDAMRGKCNIESKLGEGTTIQITLPEPTNGVAVTASKPSAASATGAVAETARAT